MITGKYTAKLKKAWQQLDKVSGKVLLFLGWSFRWVLWKPLVWVLEQLWKALLRTSDDVRRVVVVFLAKVALWSLLIGFVLVFFQSGFSVSKTLSWDGVMILIRTFQ
jgi:hypothetical protein